MAVAKVNNFVAKHHKVRGAAHVDKKKQLKRGYQKHKARNGYRDVAGSFHTSPLAA
jgi:hypothetical protein